MPVVKGFEEGKPPKPDKMYYNDVFDVPAVLTNLFRLSEQLQNCIDRACTQKQTSNRFPLVHGFRAALKPEYFYVGRFSGMRS